MEHLWLIAVIIQAIIHKIKRVLFEKIILNEECKVGLMIIVYLYYTSVVLVKYKNLIILTRLITTNSYLGLLFRLECMN